MSTILYHSTGILYGTVAYNENTVVKYAITVLQRHQNVDYHENTVVYDDILFIGSHSQHMCIATLHHVLLFDPKHVPLCVL